MAPLHSWLEHVHDSFLSNPAMDINQARLKQNVARIRRDTKKPPARRKRWWMRTSTVRVLLGC